MGWKVVAGSLPAGLTLVDAPTARRATRRISGTPTTVGTSRSPSRSATRTASCPTARRPGSTRSPSSRRSRSQLRRATLPTGIVGKAYQRDARDGYRRPRPSRGPCQAGRCRPGSHSTLRRGLVGRPTTAGSFAFSIQATDADGRVGDRRCGDHGRRARSTSCTTRLRTATVGDAYRATLRTAGRSGAADVRDHRREAPEQAEAQREVRRHQRDAPDGRHVPVHGDGEGRTRPALLRAAVAGRSRVVPSGYA